MHESERPRLLLMAYECNPTKGSEAYVGWGRVLQAVREFEIDVICSQESYAAVQQHLKTHPMAGARFFTPKRAPMFSLLRRIPRLFAYNYVAYQQWQRLAFRLARRLHAERPYALVHQVNVCTFREPGYTWTLGIPYIWGPVGGTQDFPRSFLHALPAVERFKEASRTRANRIALKKPRVRAAARAAAVLLAANSTNQRDFERAFGRPVELLLETGLYAVEQPDREKFATGGPLEILWSGEFTTRKALPLLLRALASLSATVDFRLSVLGKGPLERRWKALTAELGLADRVEFLGHLPLAEATARLHRAHLFVFTSLRDTSGNVVLEALAHGVPVVCFDHQGVGDIVTDARDCGQGGRGCGIKVPVTNPAEAVAAFAGAIASLARDRRRLIELSEGATARAKDFLWSRNGDRVNAIYRSLATRDGVTEVVLAKSEAEPKVEAETSDATAVEDVPTAVVEQRT